jgi:anthrone oxygenase-like protein
MVGSLIVAEPINSRFRRLPEGKPPDRADQLRVTWRRFHAARTLLALAAFACLTAAAA